MAFSVQHNVLSSSVLQHVSALPFDGQVMFFCMKTPHFSSSVNLSTGLWVVSALWLSGIVPPRTLVSKFLFAILSSGLWDMDLRAGFLGQRVTLG